MNRNGQLFVPSPPRSAAPPKRYGAGYGRSRGIAASGRGLRPPSGNGSGRKSWLALEKVEWATLTWVDWFNQRRLLEPIGYMPPAEAEAAYYRRLTESAMAA